jgi:hypothetical protein
MPEREQGSQRGKGGSGVFRLFLLCGKASWFSREFSENPIVVSADTTHFNMAVP